MAAEFVPRIAVLGREITLPGVSSVTWENQADLQSFDDFNVVIVDLETLDEPNLLSARSAELDRFLQAPAENPGELVLIGYHPQIRNTIAVYPETVDLLGSTYTLSDSLHPEEREWFSKVKSYTRAFVSGASRTQQAVERNTSLLATTDTGLGVGKQYRFAYLNSKAVSREIITLPPATEGSAEEALARFTQTRYRLGVAVEAPPWITTVEPLPRLQELNAELEQIDAQETSLREARQRNEQAREVESTFVGLLYEQGTVLEDRVADALEVLGGTYVKPQVRNDTDGYLHGPHGVSAAVEVKGPKGQVGKKEVRQLDEWVDTARESEPDSDWVGLLIANAERATDPAERSAPLAPNAADLMDKHGYHVLTTIQIYEALIDHQNGTFDQSAWWSEHLPPPTD